MSDFEVQDHDTGPFELAHAKRVGGACVHRNQIVEGPDGFPYLVVGFTEDGLQLVDPNFEGPQFTPENPGDYVPKTATNGVPIWGY